MKIIVKRSWLPWGTPSVEVDATNWEYIEMPINGRIISECDGKYKVKYDPKFAPTYKPYKK